MPVSQTEKPKGTPGRAYHHGDLRGALLEAAREVLETASPDAVTLKSLAQRLGVSQSAPYRHFETREAVLAAVAADGFRRFASDVAAAGEGAEGKDRLERSCLAYLAFGRANPGVYKLMFASGIVPASADGKLADAAGAAFEMLLAASRRLAPGDEAETVAAWVWSTLHGLVMLEADELMKRGSGAVAMSTAVVRRLVAAVAVE